jgi:DNA-binding NtrC family response regulator
MTVLLVDDEPQILIILSETLNAGGFTTHTCESGAEALAYLENHPVELMVTDLRMPVMSGTELLGEVRKRERDLPVVFLTGFGDMKSAVDAMRLGAFDYLNKPLDAERLIQTVKRAAEHYRLVTENRTLIETLTESNRIKTQFLHGMSHEIRTPLGHITGFAEILESTLTGLTDKQERYLHNIQNAAKRLLSIFDDMMQYVDLSSDDTLWQKTHSTCQI